MAKDEHEFAVPLFEEHVHILKTPVVSDHVRVTIATEERPVLIEDSIERDELRIERVAVERPVTEAPQPRQEGDTLIVSVVEERLVIEKRLFVIEELRVTRASNTEPVTIAETVRTMRATVDRRPTIHQQRENDG